jgi:hypothetical protein
VLTKDRRENLQPHVKEARCVVEDAFDRALAGLGLFKDREPLPAERISDPARRRTRAVIDQVLARDREAGGLGYAEARQRYVEHCAFTLVNRLAALRAMEVRGFLPRLVIVQEGEYGGLSAWGRDLLEAGTALVLAEASPVRTPDEARWQAIRAACAAVAADVRMLFDLEDEYSLLPPEPGALKAVLAELTEAVTEEDWRSDDILGWVYQYYNVPANAAYKERRKRRNYRMTADDMIVANQFYTPHWVVRVLVDSTLGRIWWESIPDLARLRCGPDAAAGQVAAEEARLRETCRATCAYLVPLPDEQRLGWWGEEARRNAEARAQEEARRRHQGAGGDTATVPPALAPSVPSRSWKRVRDLRIIDPACGSGHFLLYVFDVLQRMYEVECPADRPAADAVPGLILARNLHGIDVDLRACQLAAFNLYLKARLAYRDLTGRDAFHPSGMRIVCAGARVTEGDHRRQLLDSFDDNPWVKELAAEIHTHLSRTAEIGSLLRVREQFAPLLRRQQLLRGRMQQSTLFGGPKLYQQDFTVDREVEDFTLDRVLEGLAEFEAAARPAGDVGRLLFAHELAKACGLLALLSEQYDVALMNPPYGEMPETCKDYCKGNRRRGLAAHYPHTGNNLYAAFIEKCIDLVKDTSFVGMLTSQTFMYLSTFHKTREEILNSQAPPEVLCDTGFDVLDGARVITAATVLRKLRSPSHNRACICMRMFQEGEDQKEVILRQALEQVREGNRHDRVFLTSVSVFLSLPGSVYSYWVPPHIAKLFTSFPPIDRDQAGPTDAPKLADVKSGPTTGDDPRYERYYWEVDVGKICAAREDTFHGRQWCPYAKGGWLDAFQADVDRVVDWANDGAEVRNSGRAFLRGEEFYFREGISWHKSPSYPSNQRRMNARLLPGGTIFTCSVNALFPNGNSLWPFLGYLNSELVFYLIRVFEMRQVLVGTVASLPFPAGRDLSRVGQHARSAHELLRVLRTSWECSPYFVAPAIVQSSLPVWQLGGPSKHVHAAHFRWPTDKEVEQDAPRAAAAFKDAYGIRGSPATSLRELAGIAWERKTRIDEELAALQKAIDDAVYDLFSIECQDREHIAEEIAFRQCQPDLGELVVVEGEAGSETEGGEDDANLESQDAQEDATTFVNDQVARLLSYAVKLVVEAEPEGVGAIVRAAAKTTLADRVKNQLAVLFGENQAEDKWAEAGELLGKPVEDWLAQDYFDFHVNMYRRRPIFWQLTSAYCSPRGTLPGAFSCLLHYNKLRGNTLQNILTHYLGPVLEAAQAQADATRKVLEGAQQRGANRRELKAAGAAHTEASKRLQELLEFRRRLQELDAGARPVVPPPDRDAPWLKQKIAEVTGGPAYGGRGWLPVIDYGVRVNIEPLKVARVLPRAADRIR